jgi:hypothetical protein
VPPSEDEQQVPLQQQPDFADAVPMQKTLTSPSGQRHAKWGTPATSVINAVNQTWPIQAILPKELIVLLSSTLSVLRQIWTTPTCGRRRYGLEDLAQEPRETQSQHGDAVEVLTGSKLASELIAGYAVQ